MSETNNEPIKGIKWRNIVVALLFALGLSSYLVYSSFDASAAESINWSGRVVKGVVIGACLLIIHHLLYMYRLWLVTEKQLNFKQVFQLINLWEFASAISPSSVGGSAVAMFLLRREKMSLGKSTAAVIVITLLDNVFFITACIIAFLFLGKDALFQIPATCLPDDFRFGGAVVNTMGSVFVLGIVISLFLSVVFAYGIFINTKLIKRLISAVFYIKLLRKWRANALETADELRTTSIEFRTKKVGFWLQLIGITSVAWIAKYAIANAIIYGFGDFETLQHSLVIGKVLVLWSVMLIPLTPGAGGFAEFGFQGLMCSTGYIAAHTMSAITLCWRALTNYLLLVFGLVIMPFWLRRVGKYRPKKKKPL